MNHPRVPAFLVLVVVLVLVCPVASVAAGAAKADTTAKWDVEAPFGPTKVVKFTATEGTWMNLDVSPDGKEIVFDLLGDIYEMPMTGGKARRLRGGPAFEVQPRYSPDGTRICYTSDKGGGDNTWIMNRDGSGAHEVTREDFRLLNNAVWTPDGQYLVARKHFTSTRSLGAGEMWLYHVAGGKGLQLTERKNDQQDAGEPCVSPDGRYVYYSEDVSPGGMFLYNKDPNGQIYIIRRYDRESGEIESVVTGPGGAVRPQVSPDGRTLAFVRRVRAKSVLFVQNLATGEQRPLYNGLDHDQQETWAIFGVYPNMSWTPDGKAVVFWAKGKIWKIDVATRKVENIPFEVDVEQRVTEAIRFHHEVSPATFEARMVRHADTSPDGRWVVFSAVGHIWRKRLDGGAPERVTRDGARWEYWPSYSPDGKWIVYTTWSDDDHGAIWKCRPDGGGRKKLSTEPGVYLSPRWSPDGGRIVYRRATGDATLGYTFGVDPGLYWIDTGGGAPHFIRRKGRLPRFDATGKRVYFVEEVGDLKSAFKSTWLDGGDERTHVTSKYGTQFVPSPDGRWLAFTELFNCYVIPFPETGKPIDLSAKTKAVPVKKVTRDAGTYLHWSHDGKTLHWTTGPEYFSRSLAETFPFVPGAPDSLPLPDTSGVDLGLELQTDVPTGSVALTNARVITMHGDDVIERGTIVVERNRITAVGTADAVTLPEDATVIDCAGKTIMPGLVDVHAHMWHSSTGISPSQSWMYLANLAFGVTTTHDPSNPTEMVFTHAEMVRHGDLVGPRIFSTGTILYGADGDFKAVINSIDDARSHIRRMKAVGAFTVKSYNQPRREQRQQILAAAREMGVMVVPEGGSTFYHNLTMVIDGHTGVEHTLPIAPIYDDVVRLWAGTDVGLTPTLIVGYGGLWGENFWYEKTKVWEDERLLTFVPRALIDARARRRTMVPEDEFNHIALSRNCKKLLDAGVSIQLGAHGQRQGIGAHWELWMLAQGGMTPMEALRCATIGGARYIGLDRDIGSLEVGKLADLIVLDANPLDDIHNSRTVRYTMVNGRVFDAATMNEIGNHPHERAPLWFQRPGANDDFAWHGPTQGYQPSRCGCFAGH